MVVTVLDLDIPDLYVPNRLWHDPESGVEIFGPGGDQEHGVVARKRLLDASWRCPSEQTRMLGLIPMLYSTKLVIGPWGAPWYDDGWCYKDVHHAFFALVEWDGEGEPDGWFRHPPTGRRRPENDPAQEYVMP